MSKLTDRLFGSHSENEVKKIEPLLKQIEGFQEQMQALTDSNLQGKTLELKNRLEQGETLDMLLPEAFAAMREADRRILHMEPFPVQIMGGIIIHEGRVAELKTGEGKTLTATMPVYLNAIMGKGVFVVTVNDYLAERDAKEMGPAYEFMGLSVGFIKNGMGTEERKRAYACDVTYVTNSELGFDYLRDHIAGKAENQVLRSLSFALVDEADSVLIDEARTPLIISGDGEKDMELLVSCDRFVRSLERGNDLKDYTKLDRISGEVEAETGDFSLNEKDKAISLTEQGARKTEEAFSVPNLMDPEQFALNHHIQNALRANYLMKKDKDYIVKDNEVQIVDEFTGRVLPGRRFSDGLHQALEVKENVPVNPENTTLASITYQSFFNHFEKKAGMTGTGVTAESEFREVYGMDVVAVPTNKPVIRKDMDDEVYVNKVEKDPAVSAETKAAHAAGQPVLIGTKNVEDSERLSAIFDKEGIPHTVLNARQDEAEATIVAEAGKPYAVTIATNMAGRGTDIKLTLESKQAGGLYVIGTERSESRRIDDQLIGRSGRQGDPGKSKFFLSLEDDLFRLYAPKGQVTAILSENARKTGEPLSHPLLTKAVINAQSNMESTHAAERMNTLKYDEVLSGQRDAIYAERDLAIGKGDVSKHIADMLRSAAEDIVQDNTESGNKRSLSDLFAFLPYPLSFGEKTPEKPVWAMQKECFVQYVKASAGFPKESVRDLEKWAMLTAVDQNWSRHLDSLDSLKDSTRLYSYANQDPLVPYKKESVRLFDEMLKNIRKDMLTLLMGRLRKWQEEKTEAGKIPKRVTAITRGSGTEPVRIQIAEI
ncbi:MAG: preprotein translocase subunit SecA [Clostridiales bacterium]|nr:preprotein translocase subunit SecA [Clostridiales bacterium]